MAKKKISLRTSDNMAKKKISLRTSDNKVIKVDRDVAMEFVTVKNFYDDNESASKDTTIMPVENVKSSILKKVIRYCKNHLELRDEVKKGNLAAKKEMEEFDRCLVRENIKNGHTMRGLILAANYLDVKELLDLLTAGIANHITNKSPEYLRRYLGYINDFTHQEEQKYRAENAWAFKGLDDS